METKHQAPLLCDFPVHNQGSPSLDTQRLQTRPNTDTPIGNLTRTFIVLYLQSLLCVLVAFKSSFSFLSLSAQSKSKASDRCSHCKRRLSPFSNFEVASYLLGTSSGRTLFTKLILPFSPSCSCSCFSFCPFCFSHAVSVSDCFLNTYPILKIS